MDRVTYHEQTDMENILKLREVLRTLPEFSRDYFRAIDSTTTTKTQNFLRVRHPDFLSVPYERKSTV